MPNSSLDDFRKYGPVFIMVLILVFMIGFAPFYLTNKGRERYGRLWQWLGAPVKSLWSRVRGMFTDDPASSEADSGNVPLTSLTAEGRHATGPVRAQPAAVPDLASSDRRVVHGPRTEANNLASPELGSRALTDQTAEGPRTSRPQAPDDHRSGEVLRSVSEQNKPEASSSSGEEPLVFGLTEW